MSGVWPREPNSQPFSFFLVERFLDEDSHQQSVGLTGLLGFICSFSVGLLSYFCSLPSSVEKGCALSLLKVSLNWDFGSPSDIVGVILS